MSTLPGTWDLDLRTPIGTIHARYVFTLTAGVLEGAATSVQETVALSNIVAGPALDRPGEQVTWRQRVTKPMRLDLVFEVVIDGDTMTGHSRAGRLPRTSVTGRRAA